MKKRNILKNIISLSTLVIMILAFIIGCNKDKITDSQGMNDNSVFKYTIVNNWL